MNSDRSPTDGEYYAYRLGVALLILLTVTIVTAQVWAGWSGAKQVDSLQHDNLLIIGDLSAKYAIASSRSNDNRDAAAVMANNFYSNVPPSPATYRRMGLLTQVMWGISGLEWIKKIDSPEVTRGLGRDVVKKLRTEKQMWLHIYGQDSLSPEQAHRYIKQIEQLDLGPFKRITESDVYRRAGLGQLADQRLRQAIVAAKINIAALIAIVVVLLVGGLGGLVILFIFLNAWIPKFARAQRHDVSPSVALPAFLVYSALYFGIGAVASIIVGTRFDLDQNDVFYMLTLIGSALLSGAIGLTFLRDRSCEVGWNWRSIGFRTDSILTDVMRGTAGYLAALPVVIVAIDMSQHLSRSIFKHFPTPEQPFGEIISGGGAAQIALVFLAASVVAPIVEETFYRGVLYSAFRSRMGVWGSAVICSALFAVIHPLPGGLLPIFALAMVLAVLRERAGSLLPCIVCHCLYNTTGLLVNMLLS
ncbi:MAG: CPBP family intramembrane metalloprotease [Armatimonadetes bacterium]|nr:CPBP family intramembrane metalloprotease [Armatimonadota bacterium]